MKRIVLLLIGVSAVAMVATASHRHSGHSGGAAAFDYYLLSLSYAPDFCFEPGSNKTPQECGKGGKVGLVVHGLWPESDAGRGPENCGSVSPVGQDIVQVMLHYIPTASLIQHEWKSHGSCTGLSAANFFAEVRKARDAMKIPQAFQQPSQEVDTSAGSIVQQFALANPSFPQGAFATACYHDQKLQEVRVCFDKSIGPQACGRGVATCGDGAVTLLPVQ